MDVVVSCSCFGAEVSHCGVVLLFKPPSPLTFTRKTRYVSLSRMIRVAGDSGAPNGAGSIKRC